MTTGSADSGVVYRSVARELAPRDGVTRFARDGWRTERWYQWDQRGDAPDRRDGGVSAKRGTAIHILPTNQKVLERARPKTYRYTPAMVQPMKGLYECVEIRPTEAGFSFSVIARCTGMHCDGSTREFAARAWIVEALGFGCARCVAAVAVARRRAQRQSMEVSA